jgi:hypothetical protein
MSLVVVLLRVIFVEQKRSANLADLEIVLNMYMGL